MFTNIPWVDESLETTTACSENSGDVLTSGFSHGHRKVPVSGGKWLADASYAFVLHEIFDLDATAASSGWDLCSGLRWAVVDHCSELALQSLAAPDFIAAADDEFADIDAEVAAREAQDPQAMAAARVLVGKHLYEAETDSLRALRLAKGLSQQRFAERLGVSQGLVSRWENGKIDSRASTLRRIAAALEIDLEVVFRAVCMGSDAEGGGNA